jgi:hypothetical protein
MDGRGEDGGLGQGAAVPCPDSVYSDPEREQRFGLNVEAKYYLLKLLFRTKYVAQNDGATGVYIRPQVSGLHQSESVHK